MGCCRYMFLFIALLGLWFQNSCEAYQFLVGGRDGWVLNPSQSYKDWPHNLRFQVNDTLFFKYEKGRDSVLVVNEDDFGRCNKASPIMKMDGGDSVFVFDRSGPFFFISGRDGNCEKGQKLVTVVLAVRSPPPPKPSSPANPPGSHAPPSPPAPAKSAAEAATASVLVMFIMGLFGAAIVAV